VFELIAGLQVIQNVWPEYKLLAPVSLSINIFLQQNVSTTAECALSHLKRIIIEGARGQIKSDGAVKHATGRKNPRRGGTSNRRGLIIHPALDRPEAFRPDLASNLDVLFNRLLKLHRVEDALKATEEALCIFRQLAVDRPEAFLPKVARCLRNISDRLSEIGRHEDALRTNEEAERISCTAS
jgi:tetratricopeptide (TPR) repeat protein